MKKKGVNRSTGRNIGIEASTNDLILLTDAGCKLDRHWSENLVKCFEKQNHYDVVAGFYRPEIESQWMQVFSWYTCTLEKDLDADHFIPSARSVAITKDAWVKWGGFPEHLDTCEDLVFFERIRSTGKVLLCQKAIVYWKQKENIKDFFHQIAAYAKGDIQALHARHSFKIVSVFARYMVLVLFPWLFLVYIAAIFWKFRDLIDSGKLAVKAIMTQFVADVAVMVGSLQGLVANLKLQ